MSDGKLVRDKIPEIIRSKGLQPVIHTASTEECGTLLRDKLREEVEEFTASDGDPEELADILEVLYALAERVGPTVGSWRSCARPRRRSAERPRTGNDASSVISRLALIALGGFALPRQWRDWRLVVMTARLLTGQKTLWSETLASGRVSQ